MSAPTGLKALAARKQLLVAQADLHRQVLGLERARLQGRWNEASGFVDRNRWWLLGGAVVVGVMLVRRGRELSRWIPTILGIWQELKG
jgi:hypothetical protein